MSILNASCSFFPVVFIPLFCGGNKADGMTNRISKLVEVQTSSNNFLEKETYF